MALSSPLLSLSVALLGNSHPDIAGRLGHAEHEPQRARRISELRDIERAARAVLVVDVECSPEGPLGCGVESPGKDAREPVTSREEIEEVTVGGPPRG